MAEITDPTLLAQLNSGEVTDPAVLAQLNSSLSEQENQWQQGMRQAVYHNFVDPEGWKRAAGLLTRNVATGVAALPASAMDLGVWARNKLVGESTELPSTTLQKALTSFGLPQSQTPLEKGGGFIEQGLAGAAIPVGNLTVGAQAPASFVSPDETKRRLLADALQRYQDQGLTIPPSTTNPTRLNRALESIAGKENVQNFSRIANDEGRTRIAAQALNLNPDAPLTLGAVKEVMSEAGQKFEAVKSVPKFQTDSQYIDDLAKVLQSHASANESFPGAMRPDVEQVVNTYLQDSMTGKSGVAAVRLLRDKANDAFSGGDSEMGRVYKGISQAIENQIDRAVQGGQSADLVANWRSGRELYAKAALVRDSMLPDGTVSGSKLAAAWRNDEPITGPLRDAATFAAQFPKANLPASTSGSPVSHMGALGSLVGGGLAEGLTESMGHDEKRGMLGRLLPLLAGGLAYPLARGMSRDYLLSEAGQAGAIPELTAAGPPSQLKMKALASALAAQVGNPTPPTQ